MGLVDWPGSDYLPASGRRWADGRGLGEVRWGAQVSSASPTLGKSSLRWEFDPERRNEIMSLCALRHFWSSLMSSVKPCLQKAGHSHRYGFTAVWRKARLPGMGGNQGSPRSWCLIPPSGCGLGLGSRPPLVPAPYMGTERIPACAPGHSLKPTVLRGPQPKAPKLESSKLSYIQSHENQFFFLLFFFFWISIS